LSKQIQRRSGLPARIDITFNVSTSLGFNSTTFYSAVHVLANAFILFNFNSFMKCEVGFFTMLYNTVNSVSHVSSSRLLNKREICLEEHGTRHSFLVFENLMIIDSADETVLLISDLLVSTWIILTYPDKSGAKEHLLMENLHGCTSRISSRFAP
jgi:hypothetical protein